MKYTVHCSSSGLVSFISPRTTATVNPSVCQQQGSRLSRGVADLSRSWDGYASGVLLLFFNSQMVLKGHCRCNWALVAVAFLCFISFSFFLSPPSFTITRSLPGISHRGQLGTRGRWHLAPLSMVWALRHYTEPCRVRIPQCSWSLRTAMAR